MRCGFLIIALSLLAAAGIPPLDVAQRVKLETTDQRSRTVDEAAFYALIENARDWPDVAGTVTAGDEEVVLPNLAKIMADPGEWQGRLVLLEGGLEAVMPEHKWSRSGFRDIEGLNLRVEAGGQPVILYLTDPPALHTGGLKGREVAQKGAHVKVVARFFKLVEQPSEGGESKLYPVFVGRQVMSMDTGNAGPSFPGGAAMPLLAVAVAGCIFLLYHRVRRMGRHNRGGLSMAEYRERKARGRLPRDARDAETPAAAHDTVLPDDPAAALDAMSDDRRPVQ